MGPDNGKDKMDPKDNGKKKVQFVKGHAHSPDYLQHRGTRSKESGAAQMLKTHKI